jgi:hypothetical protein
MVWFTAKRFDSLHAQNLYDGFASLRFGNVT